MISVKCSIQWGQSKGTFLLSLVEMPSGSSLVGLLLKTKISLLQTLIQAIIDSTDACYFDAIEELLNKLERMQNLCICFVHLRENTRLQLTPFTSNLVTNHMYVVPCQISSSSHQNNIISNIWKIRQF